MPITVIVDMQVKPEHIEAHAARLKVALPETAAAKGCIQLIAHQEQDDPGHFMVYERWDSKEDYQNYLAWRKSIGSLDAMGERLAAPLKFIYLDAIVAT